MLSSAASHRLKILSLKILDSLWFINELRSPSELEKRKNTLEYYLKKINDEHEIAEILLEIGKIEIALGDNVGAASRFYECLRLFRKVGDRLGVGKTLYCISLMHIERNKMDKAEESLSECLQFAEECESSWLSASCNELISRILIKKGEIDEAIEKSLKAFELFGIVGDAEGMSKSLQNACIAYIKRGDFEKAIDLLSKIKDIWKNEDSCNYILSSLQLSALLLSAGRISDAEKVISEIKSFDDLKCRSERLMAFAFLIKALILAVCGDKNKAMLYAKKGEKLSEKLYNKKNIRLQIAKEVLNAVKYITHTI